VKVLKYPPVAEEQNGSEMQRRLEQLALLATALANEIDALQAELTYARRPGPVDDGIDFYEEIERYEIYLIERALTQCDGNQTHAARLLRMKSTTLNAKMKHYGLNHARSMMLRHDNRQSH
jgi:DNA-binding NtrC family response regulator